MLPRRALLLQQHAASWRLRCFSTTNASSSSKNNKGLNLTQYVSPLLLRLHPDTIQRHSAALAQENEQAMKQLNQFLELAGFGCNNDTYNARKQVLSMAAARSDDASAPIRFPLLFHIPVEQEQEQQEQSDDTTASGAPGLAPMQYVIEVPGALVRRTLANSARASSRTQDPSAALQSPFAREWQRTTKRILQDLFQVAAIPLVAELDDGTTRSTQLALWLAEEDSVEYQHGVHAAAHNRQQHKEHEQFDQMFHEMLTKEKNIVFATTTGMEDGPTCGAHEPDLGARVPPEARDAGAEADRVQLARELSAHALHGAAAAQSRVEQDHAAREHRGGAREAAGGLGRRAPGGRHGHLASRRDGLERARGFPVRARRSPRGGARAQGQSASETRAKQIQEPAANNRGEPELTSEAETEVAFLFKRSRCNVPKELSGRV